MIKRMLLYLALVILLAGCQVAQSILPTKEIDSVNINPKTASLNATGLKIPPPSTFRILVVGHLYGSIDREGPTPDQALLEKLPALKKPGGVDMVISLGDMVRQSTTPYFDALDKQLVKQLPIPIFNAPGNHDVEDRGTYENRFGHQTFYSFKYGPVRLVVLDTIRKNCGLNADQYNMLLSAVRAARADKETRSLLIFMHQTLFFKNERLFALKNRIAQPNRWECYGAHDWPEVMGKMIEPLAAQKPVYLFAGDVGAWGNLSPYYEQRADLPITMVMTGLGDVPTDSGVLVTVHSDQVDLSLYPLGDAKMKPLETYTPEYWVKRAEGK